MVTSDAFVADGDVVVAVDGIVFLVAAVVNGVDVVLIDGIVAAAVAVVVADMVEAPL